MFLLNILKDLLNIHYNGKWKIVKMQIKELFGWNKNQVVTTNPFIYCKISSAAAPIFKQVIFSVNLLKDTSLSM